MEFQMIGLMLLVSIGIGIYLGHKDHQIRELKVQIKTLRFEKDILLNIIREANKEERAPKYLINYPEDLDKKKGK